MLSMKLRALGLALCGCNSRHDLVVRMEPMRKPLACQVAVQDNRKRRGGSVTKSGINFKRTADRIQYPALPTYVWYVHCSLWAQTTALFMFIKS